MTVEQAVKKYLLQLQGSGYSSFELARKAQILELCFTTTLALYHPAVPSRLKTFSPESLSEPHSREAAGEFLEVFRKQIASVTYLSMRVFFDEHPKLSLSSNPALRSFFQFLGACLSVESISQQLGQQILRDLGNLPVERARSYSRSFLIFCYEQGWLSWNPHPRQRTATERVFESDFLPPGIWPDRLREYLRYLKDERNLSDGGIDYYARKLKSVVQWLETNRCRSVQVDTLKAFIQHKREQGLKESTLSKYLYSVRYFFDFLITHQLVVQRDNPAEKLRIKGHQYAKRQILTVTEVKQVIDCLEEEIYRTKGAAKIPDMVLHFRAVRDLCLFLLFVLYALRLSEVAGMRLEDIDFDKRALRIRAKGNRQVRKKHRELLIEEVVWRALRNYLKVRRYPGQSQLWISWGGGPLRASSINKIIHRRTKKAGILKPISPHCLRTTCASLYVHKGMDPYSLKTLLGHESLKTTMDHYARLTEEQLRQVWKNTNPLAGFDDE